MIKHVIITLFPILLLCADRVNLPSAYPPLFITGESDKFITQDTIHKTICVPNYTAKIRNVTEGEKNYVLNRDKQTVKGCCEVDHFLSLELGGTNNKDKNLWAEPYSGKYGAREKDKVETRLHKMICAGPDAEWMTLKDAQDCIEKDWIACGRKIGVLDK